MSRFITAGLAVCLLVLGGLGFRALSTGQSADAAGAAGASVPLVEAVRAARPETPPRLRQTAFVTAAQEVDVAFEVQGRIQSVAPEFEIGRRVSKGQVLASVDTDRLRAALRRAEADLEAARARFAEARQRFARTRELVSRNVSSESEIESARAARDTAEAQIAVAESAVEQAQLDLNAATVEAPFDGYVTASSASPGQIVSPGQRIGHLVAASRARIVLGLADRQVRAVGEPSDLIGTGVAVRPTSGSGTRKGTVSDVSIEIDPAARTTNLIVDVPNPFRNPPLRLGTLVSVAVPVPRASDLTVVPEGAIKDGDTVWCIADGRLRSVRVDVILRSDGQAYLTDAADLAGDLLMTTDLPAAQDGTEVRVAGDAATARASPESAADSMPADSAGQGGEVQDAAGPDDSTDGGSAEGKGQGADTAPEDGEGEGEPEE